MLFAFAAILCLLGLGLLHPALPVIAVGALLMYMEYPHMVTKLQKEHEALKQLEKERADAS